MTSTRTALYSLAFLALCLLAAAAWYYPRLPSVLVRQAEHYLREYGIQSVELGRIDWRSGYLHLAKIRIQGAREGLQFDATLDSVELRYNWRDLVRGRVDDLVITRAHIALIQSPLEASPIAPVVVSDLLPQRYISTLPLNSLVVRQWSVDYRAPDLAPLSVTGVLNITERISVDFSSSYLGARIEGNIQTPADDTALELRVQIHQDDHEIARLHTQLQPQNVGQWSWGLEGTVQYAALLSWLRTLPDAGGPAFNIPVPGKLALEGSSRFSAAITHPDRLVFDGDASGSIFTQLDAGLELHNRIDHLTVPDAIEVHSTQLEFLAICNEGLWTLTLLPTEIHAQLATHILSLPQDTRDWLHWQEHVPLHWQHEGPVVVASTPEGAWSLQLHNALLEVGNNSSDIRWEQLELDGLIESGAGIQVDARLNASISTRLQQQQLPAIELELEHKGPIEQGELNLTLHDTAESFSLGVIGSGNLDTGDGHYTLSFRSGDLPYASETILPLLHSFKLMQADVEISSGSAHLQTTLDSHGFDIGDWRQSSTLNLENISGRHGEYEFEGVNLTGSWSGIEQWQTLEALELSTRKLQVGFEISDIKARITLPQATPIAHPSIHIEHFSADMFGGELYLPEPRSWDFSAPSNQITLRVRRWQLSQLVALQQNQQIEALGELEGELPVTLAGGRIIIDKGYLRARAPGGSIRYQPSAASQALAASSADLGTALQLLRDFQYEILSSEVELDPQGKLLLGLSLSGRNPAYYEGRQINFNINLEQNLDPLLQSLRLSDSLVERIEQGLK